MCDMCGSSGTKSSFCACAFCIGISQSSVLDYNRGHGLLKRSMVVLSTLKDTPSQLIKVAAALRLKYRKGSKERLYPWVVGFHMKNRGGAKLSGLRVLELMKELLRVGFDAEEADCGGIVIESELTSSMVMDYNVQSCEGDPLLVAAIDGKGLQFGTLAHSHLNQVLKNILGKMVIPEEEKESKSFKGLIGPQGSIESSLLKQHDEVFEAYLHQGLLFEVLACAIEKEEPEGADIISAAANLKNAMALIPHEMEALRLTSTYCWKSGEAAGQVSFAQMREQLAQSMPSIAYDPDFLHMFQLVIECGADKYPHIQFLVDFLSKFVDPGKRRLRLSAFSVVTELPADAPHMRVALLIAAYCTIPKSLFCDSPDRSKWKQILKNKSVCFDLAERMLWFFSDTKRGILEQLSLFERLRFLGNLYKDVVHAFQLQSVSEVDVELKRIGGVYKKKFEELTTFECTDMPDRLKGPPPQKADSAESKVLMPVLAQFDEQNPRTVLSQQQSEVQLKRKEIDWTVWARSQTLKEKLHDKVQLSAAAMLCMDLFLIHPVTADLKWVRPVEGDAFTRWKVLAGESLEAKQLVMVPYISGPEKLGVKKSLSPDSIVVTVQDGTASASYWVKSDLCTQSVEWVKERGEDKVDNYSRSIFWACYRSHHENEWNCELFDMKSSIVVCSQWHSIPDSKLEPEAKTTEVTVQVLMNTKKIEKGSEIIVKCPPPAKAERVEKKPRTWITDAVKTSKEVEKPSSSKAGLK